MARPPNPVTLKSARGGNSAWDYYNRELLLGTRATFGERTIDLELLFIQVAVRHDYSGRLLRVVRVLDCKSRGTMAACKRRFIQRHCLRSGYANRMLRWTNFFQFRGIHTHVSNKCRRRSNLPTFNEISTQRRVRRCYRWRLTRRKSVRESMG
jgi:hypothetical protein